MKSIINDESFYGNKRKLSLNIEEDLLVFNNISLSSLRGALVTWQSKNAILYVRDRI
ncbi:MAG: hypothetical protein LBL65_06425 [Campylobacteraceae bacterium]|nr:hypothetical protein [Campylobacteraceae bacterium]